MKLQDQVCSLELAKRLKELGVAQDISAWDAYWVKSSSGQWRLFFLEEGEDAPTQTPYEWCRAFTVAELGIKIGVAKSADVMKAYGHVWNVPDTNRITELGLLGCMTDPNIAAKMLIYLLENKLITLPVTEAGETV